LRKHDIEEELRRSSRIRRKGVEGIALKWDEQYFITRKSQPNLIR
jgi:hypothetical protein